MSMHAEQTQSAASAPSFIEREACTVCFSTSLTERFRQPYGKDPLRRFLINYFKLEQYGHVEEYDRLCGEAEFVLQECNDCHAVMQRFVPQDDVLARIYGVWIDGKPRAPLPLMDYTYQMQEAMRLTQLCLRRFGLTNPKDLKMLDFGAGWGRFAKALRACGCEVWVSELSSQRLEMFRAEGFHTVQLDEMAGQDFHLIHTEQVMEHVTEPGRMTRQLCEGLRSGGMLKISVPYEAWAEKTPIEIDWNAPFGAPHNFAPFHPLEHLTYFKRPSIHRMVEPLGMHEVRLSLRDELDFAMYWTRPKMALRNLARLLPRKHFRNYFLFSKP